MREALFLLGSYLLGAVPFGLVLARLAKGVDIRGYGSGKIGAANVLRTVGVWGFVLVFFLDLAKGFLPVFLARLLDYPDWVVAFSPLAAIVGHNWSPYIRFQGGRGVMTGFGSIVAMYPAVAGAALGVAAVAMLLWRYVSLGSLVGTWTVLGGMLLVAGLGQVPWVYAWYAVIGVLMITFQHRDNLIRLLRRKERRLGQPAAARETEITKKGKQTAPMRGGQGSD